jgi:C-terminal processing protease CtpA/Prc
VNKIMLTVITAVSASLAFSQDPHTLSNGDRVFGLAKLWEEVNDNFVYMERVNRYAWDSTFRSLITEVQNTESDYQYYRKLQKFCAMLHDGHTNVVLPRRFDSLVFNSMFGKYRIFLGQIEGKAIVTSTNLSIKDEIPVGSEILKVNGQDTRDYIAANVAPYISSSTGYVLQDLAVSKLLQGLKGDRFDIMLRTPDGTMKEFSLTHERTAELDLYPAADKKGLLDFKWYDHQIAYLALNSFLDPKIDTLFEQRVPELYKAKALIIDLRNNGGGSTGIGEKILEYLTYDTLLYGEKSASRMLIPTYKAWGQWVRPEDTAGSDRARKSLLYFHDRAYYDFEYAPDTVRLAARRIVVPTVLLIGHTTASAAEDFLILADSQKHMIKIGENSFGSTGQPYMFDLPGGGSARVCTKRDTYPDGRQFVGYGVKPDIEMNLTVKDFLERKDPPLMKALEYLEGKI